MKEGNPLTPEQQRFAEVLGRIIADQHFAKQHEVTVVGQPRVPAKPSTSSTRACDGG